MPKIEYFYAAHSVFAYLGSARFMEIAAAAGRTIEHRPVDLNRVVAAVSPVSFAERTTKHRAYYFGREIERWAEQRQVPMMDGFPRHHRNDTTLVNCMLIAGLQQDLNIDRLCHAFLSEHWVNDADLADPDSLRRIATAHDYDPEPLLAAAVGPQVLAQYEANTVDAIERSVFGSPTYFIDGDMFYGQDRLDLVERALSRPYGGKWPRG